MTEISDEALSFLILGAIRAACSFENFPILVDHFEENYDEKGDVESFTIVTQSGLRYRVSVDYEPPPPVPNTKEQNIAFRKDWDARVEAGKKEP